MSDGYRKICVSTGSRADYGLLRRLMSLIKADDWLKLQVVVTGSHLSSIYGNTVEQIRADGFVIDEVINMFLTSTDAISLTKSMGFGLVGYAEAFSRLAPDILVILGDRYEALIAAQAAAMAKIPVAHIHGGESSFGSLDEMYRHAITKMSHLHFVAAEQYAKRVIQMGEPPDRVINVGSPGLDDIADLEWMSSEDVRELLGFEKPQPLILCTYHPATQSAEDPSIAMRFILAALDQFPDRNIVFTSPNADLGAEVICKHIDEYVKKKEGRVTHIRSAGRNLYLNLVKISDAVVGNSSSGLIEVPFVGTPTVNVGDRQAGRLKPRSVIDCPLETRFIVQAIARALSDEFKEIMKQKVSLYGDGKSSERIIRQLKKPLPQLQKIFHDINYSTQG